MRLPQQNHRRVSLLALGGLALSLSVVLWGESYKMALYPENGQAFRMMTPAKLLTERERPRQAGGLRSIHTRAVGRRPLPKHLPPRIECVRRSAPQIAQAGSPVTAARRARIIHPQLTYFSFRPPPPYIFP